MPKQPRRADLNRTTDPTTLMHAVMSRRQLILVSTTPIIGGMLAGCGGILGSGGSGGGGGSITLGTAQVIVSLPSSVPGAILANAYGSANVTGASQPLSVPSGFLGQVFVLDGSTGKPLLLGTVDPLVSPNTLNAANMAVTLVFFALGGGQIAAAYRRPLWQGIVADPATAPLVATIASLLSTNPLAFAQEDPAFKTALTTTLSALKPETVALAHPSPPLKPAKQSPSRARQQVQLRPPPSPEVMVQVVGEGRIYSHVSLLIDDRAHDYFSYANTSDFEILHLLYNYGWLDAQGVFHTDDPTTLAYPEVLYTPAQEGIAAIDGPYTAGLKNSTDQSRELNSYLIAPIFDGPDPDLADEALRTVFRQMREPLLERAALRLIDSYLFDMLGLGASPRDYTKLRAQFESLLGSGLFSTSLGQARQGTMLPAVMNTFLNDIGRDESSARAFLRSLEPFIGRDLSQNPTTLQVLQAGILSTKVGAFFGSAFPGAYQLEIQYGFDAQTQTWLAQVPLRMVPALNYLDRASDTYAAAGPAVAVGVRPSNYQVTQTSRQYNWKLFGAGGGALRAASGARGKTLTTSEPTVDFVPAADSRGVQSISVEIINTENNFNVLMSTLRTDLNEVAASDYKVATNTLCVPGTRPRIYVTDVNGNSNINLTNLTFVWQLIGLAQGKFVEGSSLVSTTTTTQNWVDFQVDPIVSSGSSSSFQVTVRRTDPVSGQFTNLAVLSGSLGYDIASGCQISFSSAQIPLSSLYDQSQVRYWKRVSGSITPTASGFTLVSTWTKSGNASDGDFAHAVIRVGPNVKVGDTVSVVASDPGGNASTISVLMAKAPSGAISYIFAPTGTLTVEEVLKSGSTVTRVKLSGTLNGTAATSGEAAQFSVQLGIG
jgi:hypothetical protein